MQGSETTQSKSRLPADSTREALTDSMNIINYIRYAYFILIKIFNFNNFSVDMKKMAIVYVCVIALFLVIFKIKIVYILEYLEKKSIYLKHLK